MQTNSFPEYDVSENTTGCCPRFKPEGWDNQHLHFMNKKFVRATTRSAMHIPWNKGTRPVQPKSEVIGDFVEGAAQSASKAAKDSATKIHALRLLKFLPSVFQWACRCSCTCSR